MGRVASTHVHDCKSEECAGGESHRTQPGVQTGLVPWARMGSEHRELTDGDGGHQGEAGPPQGGGQNKGSEQKSTGVV